MISVLPSMGVISETSKSERIITPYADGMSAFQTFMDLAVQKGATLRTMIYGCTLPAYFDTLVKAKRVGADVKVIFDHTQANGVAERGHIENLVKEGFIDGTDFLIGTSPKHEIVHLKQTSIWTPSGEVMTLEGSWNYSVSASLEMNMLSFCDSPALADYTKKVFDLLWDWIKTHEPQYQTGV